MWPSLISTYHGRAYSQISLSFLASWKANKTCLEHMYMVATTMGSFNVTIYCHCVQRVVRISCLMCRLRAQYQLTIADSNPELSNSCMSHKWTQSRGWSTFKFAEEGSGCSFKCICWRSGVPKYIYNTLESFTLLEFTNNHVQQSCQPSKFMQQKPSL